MAERLIEIDWMCSEQLLLSEVMVESDLKWLPAVGDVVNLTRENDDYTIVSVKRELGDPAPAVIIEVKL